MTPPLAGKLAFVSRGLGAATAIGVLASPAASYVTGAVLDCNGGYTA
ncbi:hypothetical protein ACWD8I_34240 [Micromonospora arida]|nr:hypothetical protein [Micromonospora arida]